MTLPPLPEPKPKNCWGGRRLTPHIVLEDIPK
jgi:hypothetical protein